MAPGAKTRFMALCGKLGENGVMGGLSEIDEARKMLRAAAMEFLLRLLEGTSSRVVKIFREDVA